jgi:hypothetical protein
MARVVTTSLAEASNAAFPPFVGVSTSGKIESKAVLTESGRPLILWQHILAPHSEIRWDQPDVEHLVFVRDGVADANGQEVREEGALLVAHGAQAVLKAGASPVTLLHFQQVAAPHKAGKCVHVINRSDAQHYAHPSTRGLVWSDAGCPTCEMWLHESQFFGVTKVPPHAHTEDEVIFVLDGAMKLGRRDLGQGGVLAIDANTVYTFNTGAEGCRFINFRASAPYVVLVNEDGGKTVPESERQWFKDHRVATPAA